MGGEIAWAALDHIADLVGLERDALIHGLSQIRDHYREQEERKR